MRPLPFGVGAVFLYLKLWQREFSKGMEFREKIQNGDFVISCEVDPPKVPRLRRTLHKLSPILPLLDGLSVSDNPLAGLRMDALACTAILLQNFEKEVVLHVTCRDFTLLGLHSRLLGAWALGIENILCLTGDPPKLGMFRKGKGAFPCNSVGLVKIAKALNRGETSEHHTLKAKTDFHIGVAANPCASNIKVEVDRLKRKADAGAQFIKTQPVFDLKTLDRFLDAAEKVGLPIVLGVMPLVSARFAQHIAESIPEVFVPAKVIKVLEGNDSEETGVELSKTLMTMARPRVQGFHIFPMAKYHLVPKLLEGASFAEETES